MKRCPECGTEYPDGAGYCPLDGVLLVEMDVPAQREGWRMVMPALVRSDGASPGEDAADDAGGATLEDAATTPVATTPSVDRSPAASADDPKARAGPRRRAGRQMSHGAFAPVPRQQEPQRTKNTIVAYSAPQARVGAPAASPASPVSPASHASPVAPSTAQHEVGRAPSDGLVGRVLDQRYRIDAKIGEGGMGLVYRATHVIIDKALAIKVLRSELSAQHQVVQRFLQEAQLASQIKHPNVVEVSDYGQIGVGSAAYYVMERLSGRTLAQTLADEGRLAPTRALTLAVQIARGLGAAHTQSIVHRDLKPDNVFLCTGPEGQEQAKILDFGIARALDKTTRLTAQGVLVGTPAYMAPEQARSSDVDARADLYSLGVMLFECLAGRGPFPARGTMETINQHLFEAPPGLRTVCPELPEMPTVERVIGHLLAKDRNDRPGDANKVIALLEEARRVDLGEPALAVPSRRVDTATLGSGAAKAKRAGPDPVEDSVDDEALTRVRGDRVAVAEGIELRGRDDADIIQPRTVSPSGRIQKRPSVIIKRGTPIERFVPPPPQPVALPTARSEFSSDDLRRPAEAGRGPPLGLIIGVAAVVAMALTVTVWKYWLKEQPAKTTTETVPVPVATVDDYVRLRFESSPSGAEVLHTGESPIGQTPIDFQVPRGGDGIVFVFRLPGHVDVAKTVLPDQTKTVRAELNPTPVGVDEARAAPPDTTLGSIASALPAGELSSAPEPEPELELEPEPQKKPRAKLPRPESGEQSGKQPEKPAKPAKPGMGDKGDNAVAKTSAGEETAGGDADGTPEDPPKVKPKDPLPVSDLGDLKNPFGS